MLVVAAVIVVVALIGRRHRRVREAAVAATTRHAATDTTIATDDTTRTAGRHDRGTTAATSPTPLEAGLLSSLGLRERRPAAVTLQGAGRRSRATCCATPTDVIDTSNFVDYRSRLFADNPDFSGKKAAAGAIEFPDSDSADAFLEQLNDFGASHVVTDECPLTQVDFFDGTVAFKETPRGWR